MSTKSYLLVAALYSSICLDQLLKLGKEQIPVARLVELTFQINHAQPSSVLQSADTWTPILQAWAETSHPLGHPHLALERQAELPPDVVVVFLVHDVLRLQPSPWNPNEWLVFM